MNVAGGTLRYGLGVERDVVGLVTKSILQNGKFQLGTVLACIPLDFGNLYSDGA